MAFHPVRTALYALLFCCSVVLLGLTGYRIHYTESKRFPDILSSRTDYYDPTVVELLVTSALSIIFSLWLLSILLRRLRAGAAGSYAAEHIMLFILWTMFLVGAAVFTHKFLHLKFCRSQKVCSILETIKAFSWICWILTTFLILASLFNMNRNKHSLSGPAHGRADDTRTYPETRAADPRPVSAA